MADQFTAAEMHEQRNNLANETHIARMCHAGTCSMEQCGHCGRKLKQAAMLEQAATTLDRIEQMREWLEKHPVTDGRLVLAEFSRLFPKGKE